MAKDVKVPAETGHNSGDIDKLIQDSAVAMIAIVDQRKQLNDQASEIRKKLREAGVQTRAFEFAVRVHQMEDEARGSYVEWLKVGFSALGISQQGTLFPAE